MKSAARWLCIVNLLAVSYCAAQTPSAPTPPVPRQLASKTIFLGTTASPALFSNKLNTSLYTDLYRDLGASGYNVADTPSKATISLQASILGSNQGYFLQIEIFDVATHTLLWTIEEPVKPAVRAAGLEKNIGVAAQAFVGDLVTLSNGKLPEN